MEDHYSELQARLDGVTLKQWLVEQGVSEKSYYCWQRKFKQKAYQIMTKESTPEPVSTGLAFAEIPLLRAATPEESSRPELVIQMDRLRIELNSLISDELLIRILETVSHA